MTTTAAGTRRPERAANLAVAILLMIVGMVVSIVEAILDALLSLTSADSPGDVEGALGVAFTLLLVSFAVWAAATVVTIVLLVNRRLAWPIALVAVVVPLVCGVAGFLVVTSVVQ
jgi:hypothetical protein